MRRLSSCKYTRLCVACRSPDEASSFFDILRLKMRSEEEKPTRRRDGGGPARVLVVTLRRVRNRRKTITTRNAREPPNDFSRRPQSRRDYPLNLSILLSGGKETNQDFLSSGERTGKSPAPNPAVPPQGNVVFGRIRLSRGVASRPSPS